MIKEFESLEERIRRLKIELILTVEATGINSTDSLRCSQELDQLITSYQKYLRHSYQKLAKEWNNLVYEPSFGNL